VSDLAENVTPGPKMRSEETLAPGVSLQESPLSFFRVNWDYELKM